jgi:hypothetical protein
MNLLYAIIPVARLSSCQDINYLCRIFFGSLSASPMAEAGTVEESGVQSEARRIGDQMHGRSTTKENGKVLEFLTT